MARLPDTTIELEWRRGNIRFIAWANAVLGIPLLIVSPIGIASGDAGDLSYGVILAGLAAGLAWVAHRAFSVLRDDAPVLRFRGDGSTELDHPLLTKPLELSAEDIHSIWLGPFDQPPRSRRDFWVGRHRFPASVINLSDTQSHDRPDGLVVAFTRTITVGQLRLPRWIFGLWRAWPGLALKSKGNGLLGEVADRQAALAALDRHVRLGADMPPDLCDWLS